MWSNRKPWTLFLTVRHITLLGKTLQLNCNLTPNLDTVFFGYAPTGNLAELVNAVETFKTTTQKFKLTMLYLPD